jgi:hypothetical protein
MRPVAGILHSLYQDLYVTHCWGSLDGLKRVRNVFKPYVTCSSSLSVFSLFLLPARVESKGCLCLCFVHYVHGYMGITALDVFHRHFY